MMILQIYCMNEFKLIQTDQFPVYDLKITLKPCFRCNHNCWFCDEYNNSSSMWSKEDCDAVIDKLRDIPDTKQKLFFYFQFKKKQAPIPKKDKKPIRESSKPQVKIKNVKNHFSPINEMVKVLKENKITLQKVAKDKKRIVSILENYSKKIGYKGGTKKFIREVIQKLPKV